MRGALIGFGFISEKGHLPAYLESMAQAGTWSIGAVADGCPARRALAARLIPGVKVYEDHRALLASEKKNLDFVDIATPPCDHAKIAHAALDAGLHVLCEKPLTTTYEDALALLAHARRERRVLFPGHNYKHAPVVKAVRRALDAGKIGKVSLVTLQTFRHTHAKGVAEWRPDWRREHRYSGGGIAMDHGSHTFYLAFDWLGAYPTSITAKMSTLGHEDTEDNFSTTVTFPTGIASCHLSWTSGMRRVLYTLHGEHGAIRVEDDEVEVVQKVESGTKDAPKTTWQRERETISSDWMDASHVGWFRSLQDQFAHAIATSDFAGKEAEDALRCVELITTAYRSAQEGSRELRLGGQAPPVESSRSRHVLEAGACSAE